MSRVAVGFSTGSVSAYKGFKKSHPSIKIESEDWKNVIYTFNESFRDYILETGDKAKLPFGFGDFSISKKKRKQYILVNGEQKLNLPIDWKKTHEKGKLIYNFNFHTEGWFFGWIWFKKTARFKCSDLWYFKPSRVTSRLLAHYIKSKENYQHIYREWNAKDRTFKGLQ